MNTIQTASSERKAPSSVGEAGSGTVLSRDGTVIAFDRVGQGPPIIVVVGARSH